MHKWEEDVLESDGIWAEIVTVPLFEYGGNMKKALMNASVATMIYYFNMNNIDELEKLGYQVDVACNWGAENSCDMDVLSAFQTILNKKNIRSIHTSCPRSISFRKLLSTYWQLKRLSETEHYDLVYTQTPIGGVLCRLAFRGARKKGTKIIYAAHGFHFYHRAPAINWLLFYPIEKMCSYFTDVLITINQEDFDLAKKHMRSQQVVYIPGVGIDLDEFHPSRSQSDLDRRNELRAEVDCSVNDVLLLSVGELNAGKNHKAMLEALAVLRSKHIHYAIIGAGKLEKQLFQEAADLGISGQVHLLGYHMNVNEWYRAADIFIMPSKREGLPAVMMEAMASGLPCIGSRIRGNSDLIVEGKGGYLADPENVADLAGKVSKVLEDPKAMMEMGSFNRKIIKNFGIKVVRAEMRQIFQSLDKT